VGSVAEVVAEDLLLQAQVPAMELETTVLVAVEAVTLEAEMALTILQLIAVQAVVEGL
jgi:hypothetical protein